MVDKGRGRRKRDDGERGELRGDESHYVGVSVLRKGPRTLIALFSFALARHRYRYYIFSALKQ